MPEALLAKLQNQQVFTEFYTSRDGGATWYPQEYQD